MRIKVVAHKVVHNVAKNASYYNASGVNFSKEPYQGGGGTR